MKVEGFWKIGETFCKVSGRQMAYNTMVKDNLRTNSGLLEIILSYAIRNVLLAQERIK
jgi:hypothetical protein